MAQITAEQWLGAWTGTNRLHLYEKVLDSDGTAEGRATAGGRFVSLTYTWVYEGDPQEGLLAFPAGLGETPVRAAWFDSFHTGGSLMTLDASMRADGVVSMTGTYAAGSGPDWGWRIELSAPQASALQMRMFNIEPDGPEEIAVLAEYGRGA